MILKILICGLVLLSMPVAASAEETASQSDPQINIQISPEMAALNAPYKEAIKTLSPEQISQLDGFEKEYTKSVEPAMKVFSSVSVLEVCQKNSWISMAEYGPKFIRYRDGLDKEQSAMSRDFFEKNLPKVTYMDHDVIKKHLAFTKMLQLKMGAGIVKKSRDMKPPAQQDCEKTKNEIDAYLVKNKL